jgi:ABC-type uncharacterized transport system substrate-binding protein
MFSLKNYLFFIGITLVLLFNLFFSPILEAAAHKVLVVMSYEEKNPWCMEIKDGIDSVLADFCEVTYFYMNTKVNMKGGMAKAKEAYTLFQKLQPDGVITADDNAQWMFVVPHLKDKVNIPVMFCGVNAEAEKYGYPASNVSGSLERGHIRESIAFAKQLVPSLEKIGFLTKFSPSGKALFKHVKSEENSYLMKLISFKLIKNMKELTEVGKQFKETCDILYMDSMEGIVDETGKPLNNKEITHFLNKILKKPIIGANRYHVKQGALCAVVKTGQEQGGNAAKMLLKAMQGTSVTDIPIMRNYKGKRVINATVMRQFGIKPRPVVLVGAELVRSE